MNPYVCRDCGAEVRETSNWRCQCGGILEPPLRELGIRTSVLELIQLIVSTPKAIPIVVILLLGIAAVYFVVVASVIEDWDVWENKLLGIIVLVVVLVLTSLFLLIFFRGGGSGGGIGGGFDGGDGGDGGGGGNGGGGE